MAEVDRVGVSRWDSLRRPGPLLRSVLIFGCAVMVVWNLLLGYLMTVRVHMNDFGKFYYSTRLFLAGQDMYGPSPATAIPVTDTETREFPDLNPPHAHLALLPVAGVHPLGALGIWVLASALCLVTSARVIMAQTNLRLASVHPLVLTLACLSFAGTQTVMVTGQLSFIMLLPFTLAWASARRGRWRAAAFYLGLLISVKLFFLIFLPYLWIRGRLHAVTVAVATTAGCFAVGLLVFGIAAHRAWMSMLGSVDWLWVAMNASVSGLFARALAISPHFAPLAVAPALARVLSMAAAGIIALTTFVVVVADHTEEGVDRSFAVLMVAALLISPLGWVYYLWFLLGPLVVLAVTSSRRHAPDVRPGQAQSVLMVMSGTAFVIPEYVLRSLQPNPALTVTLGSA